MKKILGKLAVGMLFYLASITTALSNNVSIEFINGRTVNESSGQLIITTNLSRNNNTSPVTLNYATEFSVSSSGNASANVDYTAVNSQLHWLEGESGSKTIIIRVVDDIVKEPIEVFDLVFAAPTNATINNSSSNSRFEIGIIDNDVVKTTASDDTPQDAIVKTLNFYCATAEDEEDEQNATDLCRAFDTETSTKNREQALRAISPASSASQLRIGRQIQQQQLNNIGNRLSTLRSGIKKTSAIGQFSMRLDGQNIPLSSLLSSYDDSLDGGFSGLLGKRYDTFFTGNYSYGEQKETANETGFNPFQYGISTGVDYRISNQLVTGIAIGLTKSRAKLYANVGEINTSGYELMAYASYFYQKNYYFDLIVSRGAYRYNLERNIDFLLSGKTISEEAVAETNSAQQALSASGGYDHFFPWGSTLGLSFRLSHATSALDAYDESGADIYNLSISKQKTTSTTANMAFSLSHPFSRSYAVIIPQIRLASIREFSASAESVSGFLTADKTQSQFTFKTNKSDQAYVTFQFSISAVLNRGVSLFAAYDTLLMYDDYINHQFSLGARIESPF